MHGIENFKKIKKMLDFYEKMYYIVIMKKQPLLKKCDDGLNYFKPFKAHSNSDLKRKQAVFGAVRSYLKKHKKSK